MKIGVFGKTGSRPIEWRQCRLLTRQFFFTFFLSAHIGLWYPGIIVNICPAFRYYLFPSELSADFIPAQRGPLTFPKASGQSRRSNRGGRGRLESARVKLHAGARVTAEPVSGAERIAARPAARRPGKHLKIVESTLVCHNRRRSTTNTSVQNQHKTRVEEEKSNYNKTRKWSDEDNANYYWWALKENEFRGRAQFYYWVNLTCRNVLARTCYSSSCISVRNNQGSFSKELGSVACEVRIHKV